MDVEKVVVRAIGNVLCSENKITPDLSLSDDLDADSLDCVEIIMEVEDQVGIDIPDKEAEKFVMVQDIISFVERQLN